MVEIEEYQERKLTGLEKASILLLSVGKESASKVLGHLNPREVQQIGTAMTDVEEVSHTDIAAVMQSFLDEFGDDALGVNPTEYAQSLMVDALGDGAGGLMDAALLGDQVKGLEALKWMHPATISNMLKNEHPQVIAIVLSYFEPDLSAEILAGIPERFQSEVIYRIATLSTIQPRALFDLNEVLERASSDGEGGKLATIGGEKRAAEILNLVGGGVDTKVLDDIAIEHEDVSKAIQDKMFVFEDISGIDPRGIQTLLGEVPNDILKVALKGADQKMTDLILSNMSKRQAEMLREELEMSGPVKLSDVEDAQRNIIQTVRRLADEDKLMMPGGAEEFV
ncbi:MAG: flagellar motor switch protein FliG [Piscirickettsiaceae bacterium CG_4_9_14_3_um_filter_43_564]|nr:flagellar motor switch protein FliG [Thiomicrospira sp.]PIQ02662.1 MAG: flagellar motor switch protein FliG [Piscirickettsiaceae bacterium CG18_big_fil_WC_8_21_14_2_50_44_103]PIU38547.1 MAG: flagellar motor switch protein FliG [Piscirickettsiaceae bacterium CG07_land_8_20_14_0_80_44_28]PIW57648.1 MAG: flagellar motor switch protein FliG [Piscirickettsiaceae bacterium CG12_big_fil_rev_8_21_14_0_65_44_934]PIW77747.1 MAG: flagellar motor switch protein FliG [Piscirickettsiaceae bacterium CG_4_8